MTKAVKPSTVFMPAASAGPATVLAFLCQKFPRINEATWRERIVAGKVHRPDGTPFTLESPLEPHQPVCYYREVAAEPVIPFQEQILFEDELILVACKPHFLPVHPTGPWIEQSLINRLQKTTANPELILAHRIDRETAGLVLCCKQPQHRAAYQRLFATGDIHKAYRAVARVAEGVEPGQRWTVRNRMAKGEPWFRMQIVAGEPNSHSSIECLKIEAGRGLFALSPHTGKTHQLRVHMNSLGMPLENDNFYPQLQPRGPDNYDRPLQLLACSVAFTDPITGEARYFQTDRQLQFSG